MADESAPEQLIVTNSRERGYEAIQRKLLPQQINSILAAAIGGNLHQQQKLFEAMMDTWPKLQRGINDIEDQVSTQEIQVVPHIEAGAEKPTSTAQQKADFVKMALDGMRGEVSKNELDAKGLIRNIAYGYYASPYTAELHWDSTADGIVPVSAKSVSARFYGYPAVANESIEGDELRLFPDGIISGDGLSFTGDHPYQFVISQRSAFPGHPSITSPLRALSGYWVAGNVYGLEWFANFCQIYGIPFRWATYTGNDAQKVADILENMGSQGWGAFPEGTQVNFEASHSGTGNPSRELIDLADKKCDMFLTGQTLTSDEGASGSRALGEVHRDVEIKAHQAVANYTGRILTNQVAEPIVALNFGNTEELPKVLLEIPEEDDGNARADRIGKLVTIGIPLKRDWVYAELGAEAGKPEEGDEIFEPVRQNSPEMDENGDESDENDQQGSRQQNGQRRQQEEEEDENAESAQASSQDSEELEQLIDNVLEGATRVKAQWLAPVRPFFLDLIAKAQDDTLSEDDFGEALTKAQRELPDLFDSLNTEALIEHFEKAQSSGLVLGALDKLEEHY